MENDQIFKFFDVCFNLESRVKSIEDLLKINYHDGNRSIFRSYESKVKCKAACSKIELAYLFNILMEEGMLFFDATDKKFNRSQFHDFLINNFTYEGVEGLQTEIKAISKQFSEARGYSYKVSQIIFLEKIITKLQDRKKRLVNW